MTPYPLPPTNLLLAIMLLWGCGGRVSIDASGGAPGPDGSYAADASDVVPPVDVAVIDRVEIDTLPDSDPVPDTGPIEFCSGRAKATWQSLSVEPVDVTTGLIVMDCCDGFTVRWHTSSAFGFGVVFSFETLGPISPGTYDLSDNPGPRVSVSKPGEPSDRAQSLEGTLTVQEPGGPGEPSQLSICATVTEPGHTLEGLRLYVPDVPLAWWPQQERWTLHLLSDTQLTAIEASTIPLQDLMLRPALMNLLQVAYYDASEYTIVWDMWGSTSWILHGLPEVGVQGVPFVVQVDGESIFLGAFMTSMSSYSFHGPTVTMEQVENENLVFEPGYPGGPPPNPDPRDDPRILEVFSESGKLVP